MADALETILSGPSIIRERWLPPELAVRAVVNFERRFGQKHLWLACHAALPLVVTPELVNLIQLNFLDREKIPWLAQIDFLLSPLCRPVDEGLYEVEPGVREVLLVELENHFGWQRPLELARFLRAYLTQKPDRRQRPDITRTHQWIALAYIDPDQVIEAMNDLLEKSLPLEDTSMLRLSDQIQLATMPEIAAEPLERTNLQTEYRQLVNSSRVLAQILYSDRPRLQQEIAQAISTRKINRSDTSPISPAVAKWLEKEIQSPEHVLGFDISPITEEKPVIGSYNLEKIYTLLAEAFTNDELRCLCYDRPEFRPVYDRFTQDTDDSDAICQLIIYAVRTSQLATLLSLAKEHNPDIYEKYYPYDEVKIEPPPDQEVPIDVPPWLNQFGFHYHPFSFPKAEDMPLSILIETFVAHPGFDEYILDFEYSAVLLAPPGSGKTAARLRLASALNQQQQNAFAEQASERKTTYAPLVVVYDDFQEVVQALPDVSLRDHAGSLLSAMAEAICELIIDYPNQFLTLDDRLQDWWWGFLEEYLRGEKLEFRLQESLLLLTSWQRQPTYPYPFHPVATLQDVLTSLRQQLNTLGINKLFVLVDGVDVQIITEALSDLENLAENMLNVLPLLPLPGVIWKFFLPHSLETTVFRSDGYKTGRLRVVPINWDSFSLLEFLVQRLSWASDGAIESLTHLCDMELMYIDKVDIDQELVQMALHHNRLGPPRALLDLGSQLLQKSAKGTLISWDDWNTFKNQVQPDLVSQPTSTQQLDAYSPGGLNTLSNKILIVTVTKVEAQAVLEVFSQAAGEKWIRQLIGNKTYYHLGIHGGAPVFMVQSGMGTATPGGSLVTVRQAIQDLQPQAVIICGIAFGLRPDKQQLGDILVARQLHYYEAQKVDFKQGQMPLGDRTTSAERLLDQFRSGDIDWEGPQTHFGIVLSGEKLVNDSTFRDRLLKIEPEAIGGEMEGAGLYAAAREAKVDWILVKAICDWADGTKNDDAQPQAARNAAQFVLHVLQLGGWGRPEQLRY